MIRRTFVMAAAAAAVLAALPAAAADPNGDPAAFVRDMANEVLDIIRKDPALMKADPERVRKLVDEKIQPYVDMRKMTRMSVGRMWRQASDAQRTELVQQFQETLTRVYSGAFSAVKDHRVELKPSRAGSSDDDRIVRTQVVSGSSDPFAIDYRVSKTETGWKIYDVNVEGIWLVANYRSQFAEVLNTSGIDGLIAQMKSRNSAAAKK